MAHWRPDCEACVAEVVAVVAGPVYRDRVLWWRDRLAACAATDLGRPVGLPPVLVMADGRVVNGNHRAYVAAEFRVRLWGVVVELSPVPVWVPGPAPLWTPEGGGKSVWPWICTGNVCQVLPADLWRLPAVVESFGEGSG